MLVCRPKVVVYKSKENQEVFCLKRVKLPPENVRVEGLEPPRREALDPKSSVSTNFTTPALERLK